MTTIQLRRGTSSEWAAVNPVLAAGEVGVELDTKKFKIGDGANSWANLTYHIPEPAIELLLTNGLSDKADADHIHTEADIIDLGDYLTDAPSDGKQYARQDNAWSEVAASFGVSVKDHGATGDGTTDDTAAITAAITAAGPGGTVSFPRGTYMVSSPIRPLRQQRLVGEHVPKYDPAEYPQTECAIRATAGFTGSGVIERASGASGVRISDLAILGRGMNHATPLHGIYLGATSGGGEMQWWMDRLTISACSGGGIAGRLWVGDLRDLHIARCGWAVHTVNDENWTDVRVLNCQFYFNRNGGVTFDSNRKTGLVTIVGTRVERSGNQYTVPSAPLNPDAPGIRLGNCKDILLIGVSTDACTGPGLWIGTDVTDGSKSAYSIIVSGCEFLRDGGGNQTAETLQEGVRLRDCAGVQFVGSIIGYGAHDDGGAGIISPLYGMTLEEARQCMIGPARIEALPFENSLLIGSANYGTSFDLTQQALSTLPVVEDENPPPNAIRGATYWSATTGTPKYWTGTKYVDALGADGSINAKIRPGVDLDGTIDQSKTLRFSAEEVVRWALTHRPAAAGDNFTVDRFDAAGAYQSTPITIRSSDGMVFTGAQYVQGTVPSQVVQEVRSPASPTASIWKVTDGDGSMLAQVRFDGQFQTELPIRTADAVEADEAVTKAQLDAAVGADLYVNTDGDDMTGSLNFDMVAASDRILAAGPAADPQYRLAILADGELSWGPGSASRDLSAYRSAAGELTVNSKVRTNQVRPLSGQSLVLASNDGATKARVSTSGVQFFLTSTVNGGGDGVIAIGNATVVPTAAATGAALLYAEGGVLKVRNQGGTASPVATLAEGEELRATVMSLQAEIAVLRGEPA